MTQATSSDPQAAQRDELLLLLQSRPIADLRHIARTQGWPLKGTAKSDLVAQLAGYLLDAPRMRAIYDGLAPTEAAVLQWHSILTRATDAGNLATALSYAEERNISSAEYTAALEALQARGLVYMTPSQYLAAPAAFGTWLPPLRLPGVHTEGQFVARPAFSVSELNTNVYRLISRIESESPTAVQPTNPASSVSPGSSARPFTKRIGLVPRDTLVSWGYATPAERDYARFLLEQLVLGQVVKLNSASPDARLVVDAAARAAWESTPPHERVLRLRTWWTPGSQQAFYRTATMWNELDLAIGSVEGFTLRYSTPWADAFAASIPVDQFRHWLMLLLLRLDSAWNDIEQFVRFIHHAYPTPLGASHIGRWQWYTGGKALDSTKMDWQTWHATNGRFVEAFLTGPARWLGLVEVGYQGQKPVAFRLQPDLPVEEISLPPDLLQFVRPNAFILKNVWQAGPLHALLRQVAIESGRNSERIHYQLNAAVFRNSLAQGLTVDKVTESFAATGGVLPAEAVARLRDWEQRAGRYRLHEEVAVIEFSADMTAEEIQAIVRIGGDWLYQVAPRCIVALDAARVPELVADLRRRGYTPQVVS
jgi:hypothetical protein